MRGLNRRFWSCLAGIAACFAVAPVAVSAPGFPSFDELRESLIAGRVQPNAPWRSTLASTRGGPWREGPLGLHVEGGTGERWWIPKDAPATVEDGIVRFRVVPGDRPELGLLFRVEEDAQGATLSGYELQLAGKDLALRRWDRGLARGLGPSATLRRRAPAAPLEVIVFLVGPQLTALVFDGESFEQLAVLSAYETTYAVGRVGLRIGEAALRGTTLTLLSTMTTTAAHLVPPPNKQGPLYGPQRGPGTTPLGPERYVWIAASDLAFVPPDLATRSLGPAPLPLLSSSSPADAVVLHVDALGLERLRRAGVSPLAIDGDVPWKTLDPELRAALGSNAPMFPAGAPYPGHYKDPAMVESLLRSFHEQYPQQTALIDLGRTHLGRTLWALKISDYPFDDDGEPRVLLHAGDRGDHPLSVEVALDAIHTLLTSYGRDPKATAWVDGLEIFVLPLLNPDGAAMFIHESRSAGHKNARDSNHDGVHDPYEGVNVSRNFPGVHQSPRHAADPNHAGPHGGSEPETEAFMELAREQRFVASLGLSGVSARKPSICAEAAGPIGEAFVAALAAASTFARECPPDSSHGGAAWIARTWGTAALSVAGLPPTPPKRARDQVLDTARPLWKAFLSHVLGSPRVLGTVRSSAGSPVEATLEIEGDAWPSDPDGGTFDRLLPRRGRFTLRATASGYAPAEVLLDVGSDPARLEIVLVDDPAAAPPRDASAPE